MSCVEDGTETAADDVGRNDLIGVVAEGFVGCRFHCRVDAFNGCLSFDDCDENGGGSGGSGNALCRADELAVEFRNDKTDCFCCAGAVGDDVDCSRTASSQIAFSLRTVKGHLVAGVCVHGGHDTAHDGSVIVERFRHRSEAVGGAACCGDDGVGRFERGVVDVVNDCGKIVACGCGDDDLACACVDMSLRFCFGSVETGAFQNDVNAECSPRKFCGFCFCIDGDFLSVNDDVAVFFHRAVFVENCFAAFYGVRVCIVALS